MYYGLVLGRQSQLRLCKRCFLKLTVLQRLTPSYFIRSNVTDSGNAPGQPEGQGHSPLGRENQDPRAPESNTPPRYNAVHIQMISEGLHRQVFKEAEPRSIADNSTLSKVVNHLKSFDLWDKKAEQLKKIDFQLPSLLGANIDEHFRELAQKQSAPYIEEVEVLLKSQGPEQPKEWKFQQGWTRYDPSSGGTETVPYPLENGVVFDVEVLMKEGHFPTMATAVSAKAWYSWCSSRLFESDKPPVGQAPTLEDLIPMESLPGQRSTDAQWQPRLVIGHNVGFDRTFIKEQYYIQGTKLRFLDTMSMHIAVSGLTSLQRILYMANKTGSRRKEVIEHEHGRARYGQTSSLKWLKESTLNNLNDVYQLYCEGAPLDKDKRNVFIEGSVQDVKDQFQNLMNYCASDVEATLGVFKKLWPQFTERFPHPVTLSGMMEMGSAYLPINQNWQRYIDEAQKTYDDLQQEMNQLLQRLAEDACGLMEDGKYKEDVWLWDLDWSVRNIKYKKAKPTKKAAKGSKSTDPVTEPARELAMKQPHMPGYPRWYADLCPRDVELAAGAPPGPSKITTQQRITPKLLNLTWDGYPLHYDATHGWGYVVPKIYRDEGHQHIEEELDRQEHGEGEDAEKSAGEKGDKKVSKQDYPHRGVLDVVAETRPQWFQKLMGNRSSQHKADDFLDQIHRSTGEENQAEIWVKYKHSVKAANGGVREEDMKPRVAQPGIGPYPDVVPGCDFYKLPHKDGDNKRVGNPLAKDFLSKIEEGILQSRNGSDAEIVLKCSKMCSYWKNNMDRIRSQMAICLKPEELPEAITQDPDYEDQALYGAILPRVVSAGTVTRRAVESTWLTASNAYVDRVGSEMKAMIQIPPGFHFVGADVDSQELWIASVLGDAYFAGVHGCTALSWMTLQGNKADGTDLHSRTAALVDITRDQAKVFNYGRIYGAGVRFAEQLLRQFNHRLTTQEARNKAKVMYKSTKGKKIKVLYDENELDDVADYVGHHWTEGSESSMFNMLEKIAVSKEPRTPVLGCKISKTLQPSNVADDFMTSRVNWVVQSSAVDYLHLMLVCMRWLLEEYNIDGRFCISIHDEVRYIVRSEDRYRAALALQITNLLTRAMFAHKLGMNDLPQTVAFFSAVDIDTCLRKEVVMDCVTPSNPRGLEKGYNMPKGEALTMDSILQRTKGSLYIESSSESASTAEDIDDDFLLSRYLI